MSTLAPQDHAEAIALFRSEIVGALTRRELDRGDLAQALTELSQQRFRPPLAKSTKTYSVATLERWFYAYKSGGLDALELNNMRARERDRHEAHVAGSLLPKALLPVRKPRGREPPLRGELRRAQS